MEGLCLTSDAASDRNRPAVARSTVADVLWSLVLPWNGEYVDAAGGRGGESGAEEKRHHGKPINFT